METEATAGGRGPWRRVVWCGVLALAWAGLGHVYLRAWRIGVALLCLELANGLALVGITRLRPSPALLACLVAVNAANLLAIHFGGAIDAMRRARRPGDRLKVAWWRSTWFAALASAAASAAIGSLPVGWRNFAIHETSNLPTLMPGDYLLASAWPAGRLPERGDMIVFQMPRDRATDYIKRVIGLPGDRVRMRHGDLVLNGEAVRLVPAGEVLAREHGRVGPLQLWREILPDGRSSVIGKYPEGGPLDDTREVIVPAGHVFVLGDNRDNSLDSRVMGAVGFIPFDHIVARAEFVFWADDRARIPTLIE